jgi:transcriptional regulator with XRE-family HTH domain
MAERAEARRRRGYWVRLARKRRGWGQKELAHALGYNDGQTGNLSKWESGERPIPSDLFEPLARALGLPSDFLVRPPMTDEERLDLAIQSASDAERRDWESEPEPGPGVDDELADEPSKRSA